MVRVLIFIVRVHPNTSDECMKLSITYFVHMYRTYYMYMYMYR